MNPHALNPIVPAMRVIAKRDQIRKAVRQADTIQAAILDRVERDRATLKPLDFLSLARAWCLLQESKRVVQGIVAPGSVSMVFRPSLASPVIELPGEAEPPALQWSGGNGAQSASARGEHAQESERQQLAKESLLAAGGGGGTGAGEGEERGGPDQVRPSDRPDGEGCCGGCGGNGGGCGGEVGEVEFGVG